MLSDGLMATNSVETGRSENNGIQLTGGDFAETGIYVSANVMHLQVGASRQKLGAAARRPGSHRSAKGQRFQGEMVAGA